MISHTLSISTHVGLANDLTHTYINKWHHFHDTSTNVNYGQ